MTKNVKEKTMELKTKRMMENSKRENCMREILAVYANNKMIARIHNGNGKKAMLAYPKYPNIKAFCDRYLSDLPNDFAKVEKIVKRAGKKFESLEDIWALEPMETVEAEKVEPKKAEPKAEPTAVIPKVAESKPVVALERLSAEQKESVKDIYARCKTNKDKALVLDTIVALL